jgi:replicative DNA helicase
MSEAKYNEQLADWSTRMDRCRGKADIMVAKQRQGPIDTAVVAFDGPKTRFSDLPIGGNS